MKTALVTGFDNSSIARETILVLDKNGYDIITTCDTHSLEQDIFVKENKLNNDIRFEQVDFSSYSSIESFLKRINTLFFDVIVNCHAYIALSGDGGLLHEFFEFDYLKFNEILQKNVSSIAAVCIGLKNQINSNGCIINITSSAAKEGGFATISYNASKAAIENLSKSLANNFGKKNIRVNCVAPGWIPQSKEVVAGNIVDLANQITPLQQFGSPQDVANAVFALVCNPFANNVVLSIDGGITSSYLMYLLESADLQGKVTTDTLKNLINEIKEVKNC